MQIVTNRRSIPVDLLKTFLVLRENRSFSRTAELVGRSQSAVSLQMKRLQEISGAPLFTGSGKSLSLTQQGDVLHDYAQRIVKLNDECVDRLDGNLLTGTIRIGVPSDFAITFLPQVVGHLARIYPSIAMTVTCGLSADLIRTIDDRYCDIVLALHDGGSSRYLEKLWREPVSWVGLSTHDICMTRPLPLVVFPERCQYRALMVRTLDKAGIPYRIVYSSPDMAGNHAAIKAGLGVTAFSRCSVPPYLHELPDTPYLPELGSVDVGVYWNPRGATKATRKLTESLVTILDRKLAPLPSSA